MYDIITFGSATWDVFVELKSAETVESDKFLNKGICFNIGSKIDVKDLYFYSGGAGTNTAATFANQGLKVAYAGSVGKDIYGDEILKDLKRRKINTSFVKRVNEKTNYSIIFSRENEDRTIFAYRGASEKIETESIPFKKLKAGWFYVAATRLMKEIVDYAFENKIKVAINPGNAQLKFAGMPEILKKTDILILNREEASILTGVPYKNEKEVFKKLDRMCPGIAIMTKGAEGVVVSDGKNLYRAESPQIKAEESTGAGDAFGSGFVSGFMHSRGSVEEGIKIGLSNSVSCISEIGAKNGLLKRDGKFSEVRISKNKCCPECECIPKI